MFFMVGLLGLIKKLSITRIVDIAIATIIDTHIMTRSIMRAVVSKLSILVDVPVARTLVVFVVVELVWLVVQTKPPDGRSWQYEGDAHKYEYCWHAGTTMRINSLHYKTI